uniref:Cadherin domain-containing protein n=1 Tax=Meloidogyne incognita TaxID=6306 RepID=A0A914LTT3_MELIC
MGGIPHLFNTFILFLLTISSFCFGRHKHFHSRVPIIDLNGAEELIGTIREDEHLVNVSPQLRILHGTGPICRYELNWADDSLTEPIPFEVKILDASEGLAQIRRLNIPSSSFTPLDCAHRSDYLLRLEAVKCGDEPPAKSEITKLKIIVQDVNDHSPEFDAPWYSFDVDEGREAPFEIARLLATDLDCGHPYGKICRYELTNTLSDNPFHIDDRGVLSAIRPLNRSQAQSHILTVIAEDCGMRRSKSVLVTVNIRPKCVDSINSMTAKLPINFVQGDTPKYLLPDAEIKICDNLNEKCQIETDLKILSEHSNSLNKELFNECGMAEGLIELLSEESNWPVFKNKTKKEESSEEEDNEEDEEEDLNEINEKVNEDKNTLFDGKRSIDIVESRLPQAIPERFSLLFSMKANPGTEEQQRLKQNILCESDANGLNRHHFSVYLRHCKLELLLRREPEDASAEFRAAEWRWNDERICDGNWHSYGLLFNDLDNVQLVIDGKVFNSTQRNPEILDDWPLHQVKDKKTRLVVGACWHGRQKQMVQHFNGHLASMRIWINRVQSFEAVNCVHGKHEGLLINGKNIQSSSLHLQAQSPTEMEHLLRSVQFNIDQLFSGNTRISPSSNSGKRKIEISGTLKCPNNLNKPLIPIYSIIDVSKGKFHPQLIITGKHIVFADRQSMRNGAALLPDVKITVTEGNVDKSSFHKLSWCRVHMRPARDMDLELFSSPTLLLEKLELQFVHDKQGFVLRGAEHPSAYAEVLEHIRYFNLRPESFPHRSYTLQANFFY